VATGNAAGIDLWLEDGETETLALETHLGGGRFAARDIGRDDTVLPLGGLGRRVTLHRLPEDLPMRLALSHEVAMAGPADLPVYVRATAEPAPQA
jgi:hypothetical protein